MVAMSESLDSLVNLLDLEPIEVNIFRGTQPDETRQRVFGGQVAGQALMAAGRTVAHGAVHSLHSYFLRPGDPSVPILYEVDRIRDGRSFTTRRVVAIQHGRAIFNMACSFHSLERGIEHQFAMPEVPDPEALPTLDGAPRALAGASSATGSTAPTRSSSASSGTSPGSRPTRSPSGSGSPSSASGSGPTASCPTIRCSTPASPPTPRT